MLLLTLKRKILYKFFYTILKMVYPVPDLHSVQDLDPAPDFYPEPVPDLDPEPDLNPEPDRNRNSFKSEPEPQ